MFSEVINGIISLIASLFMGKPLTDIILPSIANFLYAHFGVTKFMLAALLIYSILSTISYYRLNNKFEKEQAKNSALQNKLDSTPPTCYACNNKLKKEKYPNGQELYKCYGCWMQYSVEDIENAD